MFLLPARASWLHLQVALSRATSTWDAHGGTLLQQCGAQEGRMLMFLGKQPHRLWMPRTPGSPEHSRRGARKAAASGFLDAHKRSTSGELAVWKLQASSISNKKGRSSTQALLKETHFLWHQLDFLAKQQLRAFTSVSQISIAQKQRLVEGTASGSTPQTLGTGQTGLPSTFGPYRHGATSADSKARGWTQPRQNR